MVDLLAAGAAGVPAEAAADDHLRAAGAEAAYDALKASPKSKVVGRVEGVGTHQGRQGRVVDGDRRQRRRRRRRRRRRPGPGQPGAQRVLCRGERAAGVRSRKAPGRVAGSAKAASWPALTLRDVATQYLGRADVQALLDEQARCPVPDPAARAAPCRPRASTYRAAWCPARGHGRRTRTRRRGHAHAVRRAPQHEVDCRPVPARGWHEIADSQHQAAWFANEQPKGRASANFLPTRRSLKTSQRMWRFVKRATSFSKRRRVLDRVRAHERLLSYELEQRLLYMLAPDQPEWRQDWSAVTTATLNRVRVRPRNVSTLQRIRQRMPLEGRCRN